MNANVCVPIQICGALCKFINDRKIRLWMKVPSIYWERRSATAQTHNEQKINRKHERQQRKTKIVSTKNICTQCEWCGVLWINENCVGLWFFQFHAFASKFILSFSNHVCRPSSFSSSLPFSVFCHLCENIECQRFRSKCCLIEHTMAMNGRLSEHEYGIQVLLCVYVKESPSGEHLKMRRTHQWNPFKLNHSSIARPRFFELICYLSATS